jgi:hypothetical protein
MSNIGSPRFESANAVVPGNELIWKVLLDQTDIFAYQTAIIESFQAMLDGKKGKGGPFGAAMLLHNPNTGEIVIVGTPEKPFDSNAVVSKGDAGAHAEAENLSPENRKKIIEFLEPRRGEGWQVIQLSSAESCPSCRSKQTAFQNELIERELITPEDFFVIFKATYEHTSQIAGFSDAPFDATFKAIAELGIMEEPRGLFKLEEKLQGSPETSQMIKEKRLGYNKVSLSSREVLPKAALDILEQANDRPVAIVIMPDGKIIHAFDERKDSDPINMFENTAIIGALRKASEYQRKEHDIFAAWDLGGARLITNIRNIGPIAYAATLWSNVNGIEIAPSEFASAQLELKAQEVPYLSNRDFFLQVATEKHGPHDSPLQVKFLPTSPDQPELPATASQKHLHTGAISVAHLGWNTLTQHLQPLLQRQAERLEALRDMELNIRYIDGTPVNLRKLVQHSGNNSNYDVKGGQPATIALAA